MNRRHTDHVLPALGCLAASAMMCIAATGLEPRDQPDANRHSDMNRDADRNRDMSQSSRPKTFVSGKKIHGMTVKNPEDKSLGSVDDMIIDRGSGRIRYLVVKSGAVLGMGGKLVTVPYQSFGWDNPEKAVTLSATTDEIKQWPEFDKKRWGEGVRAEDSYIRTIGKDYYSSSEPWPAEARTERTTSQVKGNVKSITRHNVMNGREEMVVVVTTPEGSDREVVMGPSWYFGGNNTIALYRDTPIEVTMFTVDRQGRPINMARDVRVNGRTLEFYDNEGRPVWNPSSSTNREPFAAAPFVLFTEIKGKPVDCRGEKCGSVEDIVVDATSGRAVFLSIDPDKAFLGIGDEDRLVPWTIMTSSLDGKVHLDASKSMITSGPTTPKDLKTLSDDSIYRRVYSTYDVSPSMSDHMGR